ncbi:hypothetical protein AB0M46_23120 [Dactylosporangium sp. NPDC051485]|uniref:hypothetical protein n=1 Tax=Dactylosporangium sp. NPDC051485 TaxID=3154846 RepID=UPI00342539EA
MQTLHAADGPARSFLGLPEIAEIEINPLRVLRETDRTATVALDIVVLSAAVG